MRTRIMRIGILLFAATTLMAQQLSVPVDKDRMRIDNKLGESIPLDLTFKDESGKTVQLKDFFKEGRPVLLVPAFYQCPDLCTMILNGLCKTMKELAWKPGKQYRVVTFSIDPTETPKLAREKRDAYARDYGMPLEERWSFLVSDQETITRLTDKLGFRYYKRDKKNEYIHPPAVYVITDKGVISRCLPRFSFPERDLRLSIVDASGGKVGSFIDKLQSFCFHYDPHRSAYVAMADRIMTMGGVLTVLVLGSILGSLWYREKKRKAPVPEKV